MPPKGLKFIDMLWRICRLRTVRYAAVHNSSFKRYELNKLQLNSRSAFNARRSIVTVKLLTTVLET